MNDRRLLNVAWLTIFLMVWIAPPVMAGNPDPARPNVLLIYFDDMGYGDMGANQPTSLTIPETSAYLDPASPTLTPRLDAFAEQSLRFTNGHSADGVCTPSRYALMTGRYGWRTERKKGVLGGYSQTILKPARLTIGRMFQRLGYRTAMVGEWHIGMQFYGPDGQPVNLGNGPKVLEKHQIDFSRPLTDTPYHRGFDYCFGTPASLDMPPYAWLESDAETDRVHVLYRGALVVDGNVDFRQARVAENSDFIEGEVKDVRTRPGVQDPTFVFADYLQVQAEKVKDILAERDRDGRPFFIYVPMPAPHTPHTVQEPFKGSAGFVYGDYVVQTDYYTGVILDALGDPSDPDSLAANTIVFITSDNGPENGAFLSGKELNHDANGPFAGRKRDNYEGGTRVPFLVRWPGRVPPGTTDHPCWQGDFMATMADYLGYALQADEAPDAESFLPVLLRKPMPAPRRPAFVQHSSQGQFAVVDQTGEWKLLDGTGGGGNGTTCDADNHETLKRGDVRGTPRQLFNLHADPGERDNLLVDDPTNPDDNDDPTPTALAKEQELYALLNAIRGDTTWGASGPTETPQPANTPPPAWEAQVRQVAPKTAPAEPKKARKVLVFSLSTGFHHEVTPYAEAMLRILGETSGAYVAIPSNDIEQFLPENIRRYDAVVLNNNCPTGTERDVFRDVLVNEVDRYGRKYRDLPLEEREAMAKALYGSLADYVAGGGGLVLIHGAIANFRYSDEFSAIAGGSFESHSRSQELTLHPVDPDHPLLAPFAGQSLVLKDEPYYCDRAYDRMNFRPLLEIDTSRIDDDQRMKRILAMKRYAAWIKPHEKGRVFFCSPSHYHQAYERPELLAFVLGGIQYALGDLPCPDEAMERRDR